MACHCRNRGYLGALAAGADLAREAPLAAETGQNPSLIVISCHCHFLGDQVRQRGASAMTSDELFAPSLAVSGWRETSPRDLGTRLSPSEQSVALPVLGGQSGWTGVPKVRR